MITFRFDPDSVMHLLTVSLSIAVFVISVRVLQKRPTNRYIMLSVAFFFLLLSQLEEFIEALFYSGNQLMIPYTDLHVSHLLDFLMLVSFVLALIWT